MIINFTIYGTAKSQWGVLMSDLSVYIVLYFELKWSFTICSQTNFVGLYQLFTKV